MKSKSLNVLDILNDKDIKKEVNIETNINNNLVNQSVLNIDINLIKPNPNQPRKTFNNESLEDLSISIKNVGVIQPILVEKNFDNTYTIIAGERRFRASILANLKSLPCIISNFSEKEKKEIAIIENLQREDLNPIEEALALKCLIDEYNMTQEELAKKIGKSRPVITNCIRLLQLDDYVINLIKENRLSAGHARALVPIKDTVVQKSYADAASDKKISVNELEKMVSLYLNPKKKNVKLKPYISLELKNLLSTMQKTFGTKVSGVGTEEKGRIYIDYYTKEDLQRIYDLINILKEV